MKKQSFFAPVILGACAAALLSNCKKELREKVDFAQSEHRAAATTAAVTVEDAIYEALATTPALTDEFGLGQFGTCPDVTFTPKNAVDSFPAKLTVDFGNGCNWRGHTIKGSFELTVSGKISAGNATITGHIVGLSVDGASITTDVTIQTGSQALRSLTITMTDGTFATMDGSTATVNTLTFTREQVGGQGTTVKTAGLAALNDDVFNITVTGDGENPDGKAFSITTPEVVVRSMDCRWLSAGLLEMKTPLTTSTLDFGDGGCDNLVVLTIGNESKTYELP